MIAYVNARYRAKEIVAGIRAVYVKRAISKSGLVQAVLPYFDKV
jgi:hypothetical protein